MRFRVTRIRQISIGILAVLSLFVSSVSACACSHHEQSSQPEQKSCHGADAAPDKHLVSPVVEPAIDSGPSFEETCFCIQPAIKLSVKGEGFKFKKHPSLV